MIISKVEIKAEIVVFFERINCYCCFSKMNENFISLYRNQIFRLTRSRVIFIFKNHFNSFSILISNRFISDFSRITFDSRFLSCKWSLCRSHKKRKSINHLRISNSLLKSIADSNLLESWLNFDIKESRFVLTRTELYSIFNNNRIEKIRSSIHCIAFYQFHYWWKHYLHRIIKFRD
jgi:hypothetical protein